MTISIVDTATQTTGAGGNPRISLTVNGSGNNRLVVVGVAFDLASSIATPTINSVSMTPLASYVYSSTTGVSWFIMDDSDLPSSAGDYSVSISSASNYGVAGISLNGVNQTDPSIEESGDTGVGGDQTITYAEQTGTDLGINIAVGPQAADHMEFGTWPSQTPIAENIDIGSTANFGMSYLEGASSISCTLGGVSGNGVHSAILIADEGTTAPTVTFSNANGNTDFIDLNNSAVNMDVNYEVYDGNDLTALTHIVTGSGTISNGNLTVTLTGSSLVADDPVTVIIKNQSGNEIGAYFATVD